MFKAPFSFSGRIRRKEYVLSMLIYFFAILILSLLVSPFAKPGSGSAGLIIFVFIIPCFFFLLSQAVKRSHDLGNSGWFILIPFYGFWLLFADSKYGVNEYGPNPKGLGNDIDFAFEHEGR